MAREHRVERASAAGGGTLLLCVCGWTGQVSSPLARDICNAWGNHVLPPEGP